MPGKPWPSDAVMIVSADRGEQRRIHDEPFVDTECRDCGRALSSCPRTIRYVERVSWRRGRPIKFFCGICCVGYDVNSLDYLESHHEGIAGGALLPAAGETGWEN